MENLKTKMNDLTENQILKKQSNSDIKEFKNEEEDKESTRNIKKSLVIRIQ